MAAAHGRGSVRFRHGAWRIQVYKGWNPATRKDEYAYATCKTPNTKAGKRVAHDEAAALRVQVAKQRQRDPETKDAARRTLGDALDAYFVWGLGRSAENPKGRRRPMAPSSLSTLASGIRMIKTFRVPVGRTMMPIADVELTALEADDLQGLYDMLLDPGGLARQEQTVARYHGTIHAALERAVKRGWVRVNVAHNVSDKPSQEGKGVELPVESEMMDLFDAAFDDPVMTAWLLLAISFGARRGALCALRWRNLDLDDGFITFVNAISDGGTVIGLDGERIGLQIKGLKADNPFTATLNPTEIDALRELRRIQRHDRGPAWNEDHFVFSNDAGVAHMHPSTASHRFEELRAKTGLTITLHQLKHYGITTLLLDRIPLIEVAGRVGTNSRTIERRYQQWIRGQDTASAATMENRQARLLRGRATVSSITG